MIDKYNNLGVMSEINNYKYPASYVFIVSETDYTRGYAYRYFVQRINTGDITEISGIAYSTINGTLFQKAIVKWVLIGPERNVFINGSLYEQGVYEANSKEIAIHSRNMGDLKNKITSYTQYIRKYKN